jgi:hypothetical protein
LTGDPVYQHRAVLRKQPMSSTVSAGLNTPAQNASIELRTELHTGVRYGHCTGCGREHVDPTDILHDADCPNAEVL